MLIETAVNVAFSTSKYPKPQSDAPKLLGVLCRFLEVEDFGLSGGGGAGFEFGALGLGVEAFILIVLQLFKFVSLSPMPQSVCPLLLHSVHICKYICIYIYTHIHTHTRARCVAC